MRHNNHWNLVLLIVLGLAACKFTLADENAEEEECVPDVDLILLLDGSSSVGTADFQLVKKWVVDLAEGMHIGHGHIQIGVIQYSYYYSRRPLTNQRYIETHIKLGEFTNKTIFDEAVEDIKYQGYQTFTAHAINKTLNVDFVSDKSRYPKSKRVLVLLTDGKATDSSDLPEVVKYAMSLGVIIYAVGVGKYDINQLHLITDNHKDRVFVMESFDDLRHIIQDLQFQVSSACDCNVDGSIGNNCDPCSQACTCKPNVVGRRCDQCQTGFFGLQSGNGCSACDCSEFGSTNLTYCDPRSGQCLCRDGGLSGRRCDECADGFHGFPECRACNCNGFATSCDDVTGVCRNCSGGRTGDHCETCPPGHYWNINRAVCMECECNNNINASDPEACNPVTGMCERCLHNTAGKNCAKCAKFYHGNAKKQKCTKCDCDLAGTDLSHCEGDRCVCNKQGNCKCLANVRGKRCDRCAPNHWGLVEGKGCQKCGCNATGALNATCHQSTGKCHCKDGFNGMKCHDCAPGYDAVDNDCVALADLQRDETTVKPIFTEPTPTDESPAITPTTSTTTTTIATTTTLRTTPVPRTTRRTTRPYRRPSARPRVNPGWSHCTFCGGYQKWPSYCHGWLCRRRWPHHYQRPSPVRCYSGHWGCRSMVNNYYGRSSYHSSNNVMSGYYSAPSYYRGYYHHRRQHYRAPKRRYSAPARFNLYKSKK